MATTTPNNGWAVPTSTDFVKDGATAIETLGDAIDTSVGTGLLTWTTFVPTFTTGFTIGNGVWDTQYAKLGKTVHWRGSFTCGTTTTFSLSSLTFTNPFSARSISQSGANGHGKAILANNSVTNPGGIRISAAQTSLYAENSAGTYAAQAPVTSTIPFTWTAVSTTYFSFNVTYEAA